MTLKRVFSVLILLSSAVILAATDVRAAEVQVTFTVVDQYGAEIVGSRIAISGVATVDTGDPIELQEGTHSIKIFPGLNGSAQTSITQLSRYEQVEVTASTTSFEFEWITSTVTLDVVDQDKDALTGSQLQVDGLPGRAETDVTFTLPITDESVYTTMTGSAKPGYRAVFFPGLNGVKQTTIVQLSRAERFEVTQTTTAVDFEWITSTVTLDVVDQDKDALTGSQLQVDGLPGRAETDVTFTLPITDESIYSTITGSAKPGYRAVFFPGLNGVKQTTIVQLSRAERFEVAEATTAVDFEWITSTVTLDVVDQDKDALTGSQLQVDGLPGRTETDVTLTLPITDESIYSTITGSAKPGYRAVMFPGLNGNKQTTVVQLSRGERFEVAEATTAVDFEWITSTVTLDVVDQDGDALTGSQLQLHGLPGRAETDVTFTLPITDESVYTTMTGSAKPGYRAVFFPGLNGVKQTTIVQLSRAERFEVAEATTAVDFEWITSTVTLDAVDQDGDTLTGSLVSVSGVVSRTVIDFTLTLPITDESVYTTMTGSARAGYPAVIFPAIDGTTQGVGGAGLSLSRFERFEVADLQTAHDFEWFIVECPVLVVDGDGDILSGSTFTLYGDTYDTGDTLALPVTDNSVYPTITGAFGNGYRVRLMPAGTTESGTFQFELLPAGIFEPAFVTIDDSQYGLRCQLNEPPTADAGDNVAIPGTAQSTTTITGSASDPDSGDSITYRWLEGPVELSEWAFVESDGGCPLDLSTIGSFPLGQHVLTLEVSDSTVTVSDTMVLQVDNSPPVVSCPGQITVAVLTTFALNASVSDHDGNSLSWEWSKGGVTITSGSIDAPDDGSPASLPTTTVSGGLPVGMHEITLTVGDGYSDDVVCVVLVDVIDTQAPTMAPVASPAILWPPNHKMVDVEIETNAADNSGGSVTISVDRITSSEDPDKDGDGNTVPDWVLGDIDQDTGVVSLELRAERSGKGPGRTYTITITATDSSGNSTTVDVTVVAPHSKKK